jgi:NADH:ubiquinone oxidoreductase subunit H
MLSYKIKIQNISLSFMFILDILNFETNFIFVKGLNSTSFYFSNFGDVFGSLLLLLVLTLVTLVPILLTVAFFTFCERKVLASIQRRRGPNVVGF